MTTDIEDDTGDDNNAGPSSVQDGHPPQSANAAAPISSLLDDVKPERSFRDLFVAPSSPGGGSMRNLRARKSAVEFKGVRSPSHRFVPIKNVVTGSSVFLPWTKWYKRWWGFTVVASIWTVFTETYQMSFPPAGLYPYNDVASIIEYVVMLVFLADMLINFNLAYYDQHDAVVVDRKKIAMNYLKTMFIVDVIGVFPFYAVILAATGQLGKDTQLSQLLGIVRLLKLVRLHRVRLLFKRAQYSTEISLMWLTLIRNFTGALVWTHCNACTMYFIAKMYGFEQDQTWIGESIDDMSMFERYITSLYFAVVTFTTVGYGDYSPNNAAEQIWNILYMLLNLTIGAWFLGSITLLVVRNDRKTENYRQALSTLERYATIHNFDKPTKKRLQSQLKLDFHNREVADEEVLKDFPDSLRQNIIRKLYLPALVETDLLVGVCNHFVDEFLSFCRVELVSPGEELLQRGGNTNDLYLLVEGTVRLFPFGSYTPNSDMQSRQSTGSMGPSSPNNDSQVPRMKDAEDLQSGEFINDVSFFTESQQSHTVRSLTVCKTLTISRANFKIVAQEHPGSVAKILNNLLIKVKKLTDEADKAARARVPFNMKKFRTGSLHGESSYHSILDLSAQSVGLQKSMIANQYHSYTLKLQDFLQKHISKQNVIDSTRFLSAAARGDTATIVLMCEHEFDPNSVDYNLRTALMVSANKGHHETVRTLLEYGANPNLVDLNGSSALYEAAKYGSDDTVNVLLKFDATICMPDGQAAALLCEAVFDGSVRKLRQLLRAKVPVNAVNFDKRAAAHIASAEGNVAALKVLVEFGADLTLKDRWGHTALSEAVNANTGPVLAFIESLGLSDK